MFRCDTCEEYTLKQVCQKCGHKTRNPIPARFSPEDKYGEYRRKLIKKGL